MSEDQNEVVRPFETLELLAAILLGVAAIATALASYESSLYGGKSVENYSKANKIATSAGAERSRAIVEMARDSQVEMDAWRLTKEGDDAGNPAAEARNYEIATYLYTKVMSEPGYKASLGWSAAEPQVDSPKIMAARVAGDSVYRDFWAVARYAGCGPSVCSSWGSAALHPRLYAIARYRGLAWISSPNDFLCIAKCATASYL